METAVNIAATVGQLFKKAKQTRNADARAICQFFKYLHYVENCRFFLFKYLTL
jgi:hypothetical protein